MCTRVFTVFSVFALSNSVTVNPNNPQEIISKTKIEIRPLEIECKLGDIVSISAPIIYNQDVTYHLTKPNGEVSKLNLSIPKSQFGITRNIRNDEYDDMSIKYVRGVKNLIVSNKNSYTVFNVNSGYKIEDTEDSYNIHVKDISNNEFVIGPFGEEDHGNWILSVYMKDIQDSWTELFQTITIEIIEPTPITPSRVKLKLGETFQLSFVYPIQHLESCDLIVPKPYQDRSYDRDDTNVDKCGFIVKNITEADRGYWKIVGVGRIVYVGRAYLNVEF